MKATIKATKTPKGIEVIMPEDILQEVLMSEEELLDMRTENGKIILSVHQKEFFTGPFTGPFAELSGNPGLWGGTMSAVEYEDELRRGRNNEKEKE